MEIKLPNVDWQGQGMTLASQFKKLNEETGELAEALIEGDLINGTKELLDVMQATFTMLSTVQASWKRELGCELPLDRFLEEHTEKLKAKGYLKEGE